MKNGFIIRSLLAVDRRRRVQRLFDSISNGVLVAGLLAIPLIGLYFLGTLKITSAWWFAGAIVCGGIGLGLVFDLLRRNDLRESARGVDSHYRLKDRVLTALKLLSRAEPTAIERLQLADAAEHLAQVDPKAVQPYRWPLHCVQAVFSLVPLAVFCFLFPLFGSHGQAAAAVPDATVLAVEEQLREELIEPLEELAAENPEEKELQELNEKMQELMSQLEQVENDPKESLATVAEMEQAVQRTIEEFALEAVDASLREAGEALSSAEASRGAGKALKDGDYSRAAEELEKFDAESLSKLERKTVGEGLKKASESTSRRNLSQLAKLTEKLAEELQEGNCEGCKSSACEIAGLCRKQGLRKGICQNLGSKLALLSLCKSDCAGACSNPKNGRNSIAKTKNPSKSWGTGEAGDPRTGEETQLDSNRVREQVSGIQGDGASEIETIRSTENGEETVGRSYRDAYREYSKAAEKALDSEPIPLGQRQVIRRYFEAIRPREEK